jgi:hypothetical protein
MYSFGSKIERPMSEHPASRQSKLRRKLSFESLEARRVMASLPFGASTEDTGEFMLGRIAVTPVLLESDGSIDANTENWTTSHVQTVMNNIEVGLNWWNQLLQKQSSLHTLEWVIDRTYVDTRPSTPYEPINRVSDAYQLWVSDFLSDVGFDQSYDLQSNLRAFNQTQREKHDTDWSFTIFVVNSQNEQQGTFAPGGSFSRAFAFAGGLFMVIPSTRPASTYTHETGHMFWARDEYSGGGSFYDRRGYYDAQNTNAFDQNPNSSFQQLPSIMSAGSSLQTAYDRIISPDATLAQIGWRDSDNDGIFDVLDVPLKLDGTGRYNPLSMSYTFTGKASAQTLPNMNSSGTQNDITLNRVGQLQVRIGGGNWVTLSRPDAYTVDVNVNIPIAANQVGSTIEIRAVESRLPITSNIFSGVIGDAPDTTLQHGIQGFVWVDANKNRRWDSDEVGLPGASVTIVDANSQPIELQRSIEPDNYASGYLPLNQDGVRVDVVGMDTTGSLGVFEDSATSTGTKIFKPYSLFMKRYLDSFYDRDQQLRARFDAVQSYVSIDAIAVADGTNVRLDAYDASGKVIARFERSGMLRHERVTMEVETGTARIAYVIARGFQWSYVKLDNLRFGPKTVARTASDGSYVLDNLPAGNYRLLVSSTNPGFEPTNTVDGVLNVAYGSQASVTHVDFGGAFVPSPWQNPLLPQDVDGVGGVNPLDVLVLINDINVNQSRSLIGSPINPPPYLDVNGDRRVDPLDVLAVINYFNGRSNGGGSGANGEGEGAAPPVVIDSVHGSTSARLASFSTDRPINAPTTWIVERAGARVRSQAPEKCGCLGCMSYERAIEANEQSMPSLDRTWDSSLAVPMRSPLASRRALVGWRESDSADDQRQRATDDVFAQWNDA